MNFLGLLGASDLASTYSPDGLICDDDLAPIGNGSGNSGELTLIDLHGLARLTLFEKLSDAGDDGEALGDSVPGLLGDVLVGFLEDGAAFRVARDDPGDAHVGDHIGGDLASEGARAGVASLQGDLEVGGHEILRGRCVDRRRGDDDLHGLAAVLGAVVRGRLPCGAEVGDGLYVAITLPVAADKEDASHCGLWMW